MSSIFENAGQDDDTYTPADGETFVYLPDIGVTISFLNGNSVSTDLQFQKVESGVTFVFDITKKVYRADPVGPPKKNVHRAVAGKCHVLYVFNGIGSSYHDANYMSYMYKNAVLDMANDIYVVPVVWKLGTRNDTCSVRESLAVDNPFRDYLGKLVGDLAMIVKSSPEIEKIIFAELARVSTIAHQTLKDAGIAVATQNAWATSGSTITLLNGLHMGEHGFDFNHVFLTGSLYPYLYRAECVYQETPADHILEGVPNTRFYNIYFDYDPFASVFSPRLPLDIDDTTTNVSHFQERVIRSSTLLKPVKHLAGLIKHARYLRDPNVIRFISRELHRS